MASKEKNTAQTNAPKVVKPAETQVAPVSTEQPTPTDTNSEQPNADAVEANTASQAVQNHSAATQVAPESTEQPKPTDTDSMEQPTELQKETAAKLFKLYPHVQVFYLTDDATAFFNENDANNHAKTLKDMGVVNIKR